MITLDILTKKGGFTAYPKTLTFSGGEEHIQLPPIPEGDEFLGSVYINAKIKNSSDFMKLVLTLDALRKEYPKGEIRLSIPYLPYARQDRVCAQGQAFSLEVVANILNSFKLNSVSALDVHSDVAKKLINNFESQYPSFILSKIASIQPINYLIAPDKGSHERVDKLFNSYRALIRDLKVVYVDKIRDPSTGEITSISIPEVDMTDKSCLIIDDICDGGGTFIPIIKHLKEVNKAKTVGLYVTHGIFSKGTDVLKDAGVDHIYTTNSFFDYINHPHVKIVYNT